jgi:hypothetical protein
MDAVCGRCDEPVDAAQVERLTIENLFGPDFYLCDDCDALLRAAQAEEALSDEQLRKFVEAGSRPHSRPP